MNAENSRGDKTNKPINHIKQIRKLYVAIKISAHREEKIYSIHLFRTVESSLSSSLEHYKRVRYLRTYPSSLLQLATPDTIPDECSHLNRQQWPLK